MRLAYRRNPLPAHQQFDAIVIGAGLAGCASALLLLEAGYRVAVFERSRLPRHKLCGEFLSTEVQATFKRLGVLGIVMANGAVPIRRTRLTASDGSALTATLPGTALGISRYRLDAILLQAVEDRGGHVWQETPVVQVSGSMEDGFKVFSRTTTFEAAVVIGAYGRRDTLDRKLDRDFIDERTPLMGFKAHFVATDESLDLEDWIELHAFEGGYCGMSHVENGLVNACWITHRDTFHAAGSTPDGMMASTFASNPALAARFTQLRQVSKQFEAVSQITFVNKPLVEQGVLMVGDAAGMIAPLCGDGMGMALTGAEVLAEALVPFMKNDVSARAAQRRYERSWQRAYATRMRLSRILHQLYVRPAFASTVLRVGQRIPTLAQALIRATRG
ncbi:MAG: NAD(P)/FAD-dependent oxidoreductase [Rhodothermales bacterium]